jgi:formylglycine-generating enzyme required for sulfatase activity
MPVTGISWDDGNAYAEWLAKTAVPAARLCSEHEWERAARGADGRVFPHGDQMVAGDANIGVTYDGNADRMGADEVGSFLDDVSPFGVFDLGGNVTERVGQTTSHIVRGGHWLTDEFWARAAYSNPRAEGRNDLVGVRICATPRN